MSEKSPDYDRTYQRACDVFRERPFHFSQIAVELRLRNDDLRAALDALVADGLLSVLSERPTRYVVAKFLKE